jgi:hypothetical protein
MCIVGLLAASSCAEKPVGEFTAAACMNDDDDDGDDLVDCNDPDCWVFCPYRGDFKLGDASSSPVSDASFDATAPAADSGKPSGMMDDDAGTGPLDASLDDDAGSPPRCECAAGESCVDGECRPTPSPSIEGMYTLSVKSAYVPLGPSNDRCFDYTAAACATRIPVICECEKPDPYVVVVLSGNVLMKATTAAVRDSTIPVWSAAPTVTINLKSTDTLTFIVFDQDTIQDQQIFSCMPVLSTLESGDDVLACNPRPGTIGNAPAGSTSYSIAVEVRKVVPDASTP